MRKITQILTTVGLASTVLFSSMGDASASEVHYKDVNKADNFYNSVEFLLEKNAISDTLPNFRPYENITRGQFSSIFAKVLTESERLSTKANYWEDPNFKDVPKTHQFHKYIDRIVNNHIMTGYGYDAEIFGVNDTLTRGQFAGIIIKAYGINLINEESYKENGGTVSDIFDGTNFKGQWGQAFATLQFLGYISGYGDGTFKPSEPIKRSQFANMMYKIEHGYEIESYRMLNGFLSAGLNETQAIEKLKTLKNNDVLNYIGSYVTYSAFPWEKDIPLAVFDVKKQGEVVFEDINVKLRVTPINSKHHKWFMVSEKIKAEEPTEPTTEDTATITEQ